MVKGQPSHSIDDQVTGEILFIISTRYLTEIPGFYSPEVKTNKSRRTDEGLRTPKVFAKVGAYLKDRSYHSIQKSNKIKICETVKHFSCTSTSRWNVGFFNIFWIYLIDNIKKFHLKV